MSLSRLLRPAIFVAVAVALVLAADLLWTVGTDIRDAATNPACRLLHEPSATGLDCDGQSRFGFFLAILAPFLGFGAVVALALAVASATRAVRHLFLGPPVAYHPDGGAWRNSGDRSHGFDVTGATPGNADIRRHHGRHAGVPPGSGGGGDR